jgi:hypothetical protein
VPTCLKASAPASRLRAAPGPQHVPVAPTPASRLRAAPGVPHVPVALAPASWLGAALGPPRVAWAQGSSGATTCPVDGLYKLQAIKQIFSGDLTIMIFIVACTRVFSKALRDKGCSAHLQDMQQAVH